MKDNKVIKDYLNGKTVAYVCPGGHIVGKNLGSYIDSFDVVVRCNQNWEINDNIKKDYGARTDMLISGMNGWGMNEIQRKNDNTSNYFKNLKYILAMDDYGMLLEQRTGFSNDKFFLFSTQDIRATMSHAPFTGFIGLVFLLNCNTKKVFITGMSFYNMGEYGSNLWYDEYFQEQLVYLNKSSKYDEKNQAVLKTIKNDVGSHDVDNQIAIFKDVILKKHKDKIELDQYLKEKFG